MVCKCQVYNYTPKGINCVGYTLFFPALIMHHTPTAMKGRESICPMSMGSEAAKASCTSLVYSMKKRKVKI